MNGVRELDNLTGVRATALVDHYQKTRDQVSRAWEQRNHRYLLLVGLLAAAIVLSFAPIIVELVGRYTLVELSEVLKKAAPGNKDTAKDVAALSLAARWDVVLTIVMIVVLVSVFYMMTDLFHRSSLLVSSYVYLALVENEIRSVLQTNVAFTREGSFYRATGARMSVLIGLVNKGMLGCLLFVFFTLRLLFDYRDGLIPLGLAERSNLPAWAVWAQGNFLFLFDVLALLLTAGMYLGYLTLRTPSETTVREAVVRGIPPP